MFVDMPDSSTQIMVEITGKSNEYKGLLNANFQDYMDGLAKTSELQVAAARIKQKLAGLGSGVGMAAGALGGPSGIAIGFSIGSQIGKYAGNILGDKIYGRAIADMSEIMHNAKIRHAQLAAGYSLTGKMMEAIDTIRQNENKRIKDDLQSMAV